MIIQPDNRIRHDLPGPVKRDVAAAVGLDDFDAEHREHFTRRDEVLLPGDFGATAERDDGWVFDEEELFFGASKNVRVGLLLARPGVAVRESSKILNEH